MKRLVVLSVVLAFAGSLSLRAQSPDDLFIRIYNLIQQGDSAQAVGQARTAQERYREAQEILLKLEQDNPTWNPNIISYRKAYLSERLGAATPKPAPAPAASSPGTPAPPTAPARDERDDQISQLNQEIKGLRGERETLQAKLREALSVQPTPVDPKELTAVENRVKELSNENLALRANITQLQEKVAKTADPAALAEAQKQLAQANLRLAQQEKEVRSLAQSNQALEARLKRKEPKDKPATPVDQGELQQAQRALQESKAALASQQASIARLTAQNAALEQQVKKTTETPRTAKPDQTQLDALNEWKAKVGQLEQQLAQSRQELSGQRTRTEVLAAERVTLERRLAELSSKPAAPAVDPRVAKGDRETIKRLEKERDTLRDKVAELTREFDKNSRVAEERAAKAGRDALKKLEKERDALKDQVASLNRELEKKRQIATTPVPVPVPAPAVQSAAAKQTQDDLARVTKERDELQAKVAELNRELERKDQPRPATAPVPVVAPAAVVASPAPGSEKLTKADKATLKRIEKERSDLRRRVAELTNELEKRKSKQAIAQKGTIEEQLAIARARLQAYEATPLPFTPEELALFSRKADLAGSDTNRPPTSARATRQIPSGAAPLVAAAQRAFQGQNLAEAEDKYTEALKVDERNVTILTDLAATQLERNRLDETEATLARALALDPESAEALSLSGLLRLKQNRYDDAVNQLSRAAQLDPDNARTQNYLGIALSQKGLRKPAEAALRKAISLQPGYAEAQHNLAVVYGTQKPPFLELARWHYQRALEGGHPKNPDLEKILETTPAK